MAVTARYLNSQRLRLVSSDDGLQYRPLHHLGRTCLGHYRRGRVRDDWTAILYDTGTFKAPWIP